MGSISQVMEISVSIHAVIINSNRRTATNVLEVVDMVLISQLQEESVWEHAHQANTSHSILIIA